MRRGRGTIEDCANFLDCEELACCCWRGGCAHSSEIAAEENGEDHILDIASPETVVSAWLVESR